MRAAHHHNSDAAVYVVFKITQDSKLQLIFIHEMCKSPCHALCIEWEGDHTNELAAEFSTM
jgi:hypothetical protein